MLKVSSKSFNRQKARKPASRGFVHIILLALLLLGATTYGVVVFQAKIQERKSQEKQVTPKALTKAKRGLLAFAEGEGMESPVVTSGRLPPLDYFNIADPLAHDDDFFIASRPGQLPCPDNVGDESFNAALSLPLPLGNTAPTPLRSASDGNLDGVADYGSIKDNTGTVVELTNNCSDATTDALVDSSLLGRFPWNEYYDFVSLVRGVGTGDLVDGNGDRLWYSVSPNLTDQSRPLNQYTVIREQDGWLEVRSQFNATAAFFDPSENYHTGTATLHNIAAVAISPGIPEATQNRNQESDVYGPTSILHDLEEDEIDEYLEGNNTSSDLLFTQPTGNIPATADRLSYVHRDEILEVMATAEERAGSKHIDAIADALSAYYERNRHLPDPTSFDTASTEFVNRRFGRPGIEDPTYLNYPFLMSPYGGSRLFDSVPAALQGGRVESETTTVLDDALGIPTVIGYSNLLPLGKLPFSQMPPIMPALPANVILTDALSPVSNILSTPPFPPFSNFLSPYSAPSNPGLGQTGLAAVIPAYTPVRAARPFYSNPIQGNLDGSYLTVYTDPVGNHTIADSGTALTITTQLATSSSGSAETFIGPKNIRLADARFDMLFNLTRFGYGIKMPAGTWLMATVDMTVVGHAGVQTLSPAGNLVSEGLFAFRPTMRPSDIYYGTYIDNVDSGTNLINLPGGITHPPIAIPAKTPLAAASQGLLPVELLPNQLRGPADATVTNRGHGLLNNAKSINELITAGTNQKPVVAVVTDPNGAFGYFPAEVTMHPLGAENITDRPTPSLDNLPRRFRVDRDTSRFTVNRVLAYPTPIAAGEGGIVPAEINVSGPITFPAGSRFYYPVGTKIPLGHRTFNHGHNAYNFDTNVGAFGGAATVAATVWAKAQLAPGAVLHDVNVAAVGDILPDGTSASATLLAAVTLVNGGELLYNHLLHYTDGDVAMLPQTAAQRAFRVESMGLGLGAIDVATSTPAELDALSNLEGSLPDADRYGYYLYPYHASYERRSQPIPPFYRPSASGGIVGSYGIDGNFLRAPFENLVSRADLWLYNVGAASEATITLNLTRDPIERNQSPFTFNLVDGHGLAFTALPNTVGATVSSDGTIDSTFPELSLPVDRGVRLMANPSRMQMLQTAILADTSENDYAVLGLAQYASPLDTTPLVMPTAPDELFERLANLEVDYDGTMTVFATEFLDARSAELALHFGEYPADPDGTLPAITSTIHASDFSVATISADIASEALDLGGELQSSRRAIFRINSDAVAQSFNGTVLQPDSSGLVPAGSHVEFGWMESFSHDAVGASGITSYFTPGGRIFSGLGFYPTPAAAAVRMERDMLSFNGPDSITVIMEVTIASTVEAGTVHLAQPRMLLPGGFDIDNWDVLTGPTDCGNATYTVCVSLDPDLLFSAATVSIDTPTTMTVYGPGVFNPVAGAFIGATSAQDLAGLQFQFAAHGGGFLTAPVTVDGIEQVQRLEAIQGSQVMRWSIAPHWVTGATVTLPDLQGLTELSWSGKDGRFGFGEMEPSTQVFAQNHYIHYAVEEQCRRGIALQPNIDCTDAPEAGLEVNVPPGENVRLPEDTLSPTGILFHAYRPLAGVADTQSFFTLRYTDSVGSVTDIQVAAARLARDGQIQTLDVDPAYPNEASNPSILPAMLGTTVSLVPGNQGILFQYEPNELTSYALNLPNDKSVRSGYTKQFELIAGGFTNGNQNSAAFRVTVQASIAFTIAGGSTLDIDNIDTFSLFLAEGSGDGTNDLGGLHTIQPSSDITIVLGANAVETKDGLDLPTGLPAGSTLEVSSTVALAPGLTINAASEIIIPASGRALQGIVSGASVTVEVERVNPGLLYARTHRVEDRPGATGIPTGYQEGAAGLRRLDTKDYSLDYGSSEYTELLDSSLAANALPATLSLPFATVTVDCLGCQQKVIDISQFATSTVGGALEFPFSVELTLTLSHHFAGVDSGVTTEFMADVEYVTTVPLDDGLWRHNFPLLTLVINDVDDPAINLPLTVDGTIASRVVNDGRDRYLENIYHDTIDLGTNTLTVADLHNHTAFAIGTFTEPLTVTIGTPDYEISEGRPMAVFFRPQVPTLAVFSDTGGVLGNSLAVTADIAAYPNVGQFAQFFSDGNYRATFTGAEEIAIQIPVEQAGSVTLTSGDEIALYGGSVIYPQSGRLFAARQFEFIDPTQPIAITLGDNGASGQLVGGGGVGRPILHQRRRLSRIDRFGTGSASYYAEIASAPISLVVQLVTEVTPTNATNSISTSDTASGTVRLHFLDPLINTVNVDIDSLDTRYGNVFGDLRQDRVPLVNTFFDSAVATQTFSSITVQTAYPAPETHAIDFLGDSEILVYPPGDTSDSKVVYADPIVRYQGVDGNSADINADLAIQETLQPGNFFTFIDGTTVSLNTAFVGIEDISPNFVTGARSDTALLTTALRQNLWLRITDPIVVNGVTNTVTSEDFLELPANTVINPFLGTYLIPPQVTVPSHDRKIAFSGTNTASAGQDIILSAPALVLPAGVTINSGQITMTFTDTKAVVIHSPAPLANAQVDCLPYTFYTETATPNDVSFNGERFINQRTNGLGTATENIYNTEFTGTYLFFTTPNANPDRVGHGHPCHVLDILENFDGDRTYTYTSGMLTRPDDPSTAGFETPILLVNDRMRMVGGKLRPL